MSGGRSGGGPVGVGHGQQAVKFTGGYQSVASGTKADAGNIATIGEPDDPRPGGQRRLAEQDDSGLANPQKWLRLGNYINVIGHAVSVGSRGVTETTSNS